MSRQWIVVANTSDAHIYEMGAKLGELLPVDHLHREAAESTCQKALFDREERQPEQRQPDEALSQILQTARRYRADESAIRDLMERISERLLFGRCERAFESIILVADADALGRIHGVLDKEMAALITRTVEDATCPATRGDLGRLLKLDTGT